jgi:predicted nucleic acid-binding protein
VRSERVIVDAGPLVAILNRLDSEHEACRKQGLELAGPLLTTWPVITEAAWLLRRSHGGVAGLLRMVTEGLLECYELNATAAAWMGSFLAKYADQSPQLADASLMYVAEKENINTLFSLDRRDFSVYRLSDNRTLKLLPEA